jgi:hypothetical protein
MKNTLLKSVLDWVLYTSLILSIVFFVKYMNHVKELRTYQGELARYQNTRTVLNMLIGESIEYGKQHPDMARLLESMNVGKTAPTSTTNAPKTPGK